MAKLCRTYRQVAAGRLAACCLSLSSREDLYTPPPPSPHFWPKGIFQGRGVGVVYFEAPRGRNFIRPPPFYTPPTPRRVISGVGGWGCIKFGPASLSSSHFFKPQMWGSGQVGAHNHNLRCHFRAGPTSGVSHGQPNKWGQGAVGHELD